MLCDSKLLGVKDVCNILGVSKQFVHKLCQEKKLNFENTSSGKIFLERDVLNFQQKRIKKAKFDARIKSYNIMPVS